jgi:hypothetical protein
VLPQANAYAMIRCCAAAAGIATKLGNHSFRATGVIAYLKNGGTLEEAAAIANHASTRTTQLYDRRRDELSLDEVEGIVIWMRLFEVARAAKSGCSLRLSYATKKLKDFRTVFPLQKC